MIGTRETDMLTLATKAMTQMTRLTCALTAALLFTPAAARAQSEEVVYYHTDAIGSVRAITDATGAVIERYDFLPFGEALPSTVPETRQFAGKERDAETGLDYFGARHHMSATGRFTTVDPVMNVEAAMTDPQRWNRYAYAVNRPFVMVDPDGREAGYVYLTNGRMLSPYDPAFPRSTNAVTDTARLALAIGSGLFGGGQLINAASSVSAASQVAIARFMLWSAGSAGTADQLSRAAASGGPTVRVITNLTQFPAEGRGLSTAVGDNALALANAFRNGEGVRTFAADLPKALVQALEKHRLLERRTLSTPNGLTGIEYRFAPGAHKYIAKFFEELR